MTTALDERKIGVATCGDHAAVRSVLKDPRHLVGASAVADGLVRLAIEARPKTDLQSRNQVLQSQTGAYQEINAKLLGLKLDSAGFVSSSLFKATTTSSSNESVIKASSGALTPFEANTCIAAFWAWTA